MLTLNIRHWVDKKKKSDFFTTGVFLQNQNGISKFLDITKENLKHTHNLDLVVSFSQKTSFM